jgi:NUMOD4 motif/HNH endonuclease
MIEETWLPVTGFEGSYEVSDLGRVRSLDRLVKHGNHHRRIRGKILKLNFDRKGYACVVLAGNRFRRIHTLVLEAFVASRPDGLECRHLDDDKTNNRLDNLLWGTGSENSIDRVQNGNDHHHRRIYCPLDHLLETPNLVPSALEAGYRTCLSCNRARSKINHAKRNGLVLLESLRAVADRHYEVIMGDELIIKG